MIVFDLVPILSVIIMTSYALFLLLFSWYVFFHPFTFSVRVPLDLNLVSLVNCISIDLVIYFPNVFTLLLMGKFNLFT